MESLNKNGMSTTQEPGQEKYVTFIAGAFRGQNIFSMIIVIQTENFSLP